MKKPCSYTLVWWLQRNLHLPPFLKATGKQSRKYLKSLQSFTRGHCQFKDLWKTKKTKKVESLFNNKDRNNDLSNVIYHGTCSCQANYVSETSRNLQERISEHTETLQTCLKSLFKPHSLVHLESHSSHSLLDLTSHHRNFIYCKPLLQFKQTSIRYFFVPLPLGTYALKLASMKLYATFSHLSYTWRWFFNF